MKVAKYQTSHHSYFNLGEDGDGYVNKLLRLVKSITDEGYKVVGLT